jgi:NO-binding membrane sensor protein with MHYT domain
MYGWASSVRHDIPRTVASAVTSVAVVGFGVLIAGTGPARPWKVLLGGTFIGAGTAAMHYVGMTAVRIDGFVSYKVMYVVFVDH